MQPPPFVSPSGQRFSTVHKPASDCYWNSLGTTTGLSALDCRLSPQIAAKTAVERP
jgi:hypothetical protein